MKPATLYIFSGLPGVGKSTLAKRLAQYLNAAYLRIDTVEQALRDLCQYPVEGEGYRLSYRMAKDSLLCGVDVVADSCNPIELTRDEWQNVALEIGARAVNIEVVCLDKSEHRRRVEQRIVDIENLRLPTWHQVQSRQYHVWHSDVVRIDTAGCTVDESFSTLVESINGHSTSPLMAIENHRSRYLQLFEYENGDNRLVALDDVDLDRGQSAEFQIWFRSKRRLHQHEVDSTRWIKSCPAGYITELHFHHDGTLDEFRLFDRFATHGTWQLNHGMIEVEISKNDNRYQFGVIGDSTCNIHSAIEYKNNQLHSYLKLVQIK